MISRTNPRFWDAFGRLDPETQRKVRRAYELFQNDPRNSGLRFKRVQGTRNLYSARIDSNYRALARVEGDVAIWYWVGPHDEYERMIP